MPRMYAKIHKSQAEMISIWQIQANIWKEGLWTEHIVQMSNQWGSERKT